MEETNQEWTPTQGESVWVKVFSNWSLGTYIGYDIIKQTHIVREDEKGGGHLMASKEILPYFEMPNQPKEETLEEAAERLTEIAYRDNPQEEGSLKRVGYYQGIIDGAKWQAEKTRKEALEPEGVSPLGNL